MKMKAILVAVPICMLLLGCSVPKDWVATGGSRADATVKLSIQHGEFEVPVTDDAQALRVASERCRNWGYEGAEAFGGVIRAVQPDGSIMLTKEYQCIGQGNVKR